MIESFLEGFSLGLWCVGLVLPGGFFLSLGVYLAGAVSSEKKPKSVVDQLLDFDADELELDFDTENEEPPAMKYVPSSIVRPPAVICKHCKDVEDDD